MLLAGLSLFGWFWINHQPIGLVYDSLDNSLQQLPGRNQSIIDYIENNGKKIAPTYQPTVCTEFVINVIEHQVDLTKDEKRMIRIITNKNIEDLISSDSMITRGVQVALAQSGKGSAINDLQSVKPGDFVQFWNLCYGKAYGHCGVVMDLEPGKSLTVYSSHPVTNGYGRQKFLWPDKIYFARLK